MSDALFPHPGSDELLLTVNNRLARELIGRHAQRQVAASARAWRTPDIIAWNAWLESQHEVLLDSGQIRLTLLNPHQERLLWEEAVTRSREGKSLLRPLAAARTAQKAWQILHDWLLTPESLAGEHGPETRLFVEWAGRFRERCEETGSISTAALGEQLANALQEGWLEAPGAIRLAGFDRLTPLQQRILESLQAAGAQVSDWRQRNPNARARRIGLPDRDAEHLAAAEWAAQTLGREPEAKLAIISPRLEEDRAGLKRALQMVLEPAGFLAGREESPRFNISLGRPLSEYPLVADLLLALRLTAPSTLRLQDISLLLRSPFLGGHTSEWGPRSELDRYLRERGQPALRRADLLFHARQLSRHEDGHCPDLILRLQQLQELLDAFPPQDSPNAWSGHLLAMMEVLGWPGDQALDSAEYQQAVRLRELVSEFSTLARVRSSMRLSQAVSRFRQMCEDTTFQPRHTEAPVQVLGMLEAAGLEFDGIWILGLDDQTWPAPPSPNPLLPVSLQRERHMPHASAERELAFARDMLGRLLESADNIVLSHALREQDREQRPSSLILPLAETDMQALGISPRNPLYPCGPRESTRELLPHPGTVPTRHTPAGGTALLADQATCPFRALARHRLMARALPEPQQAPDARLLGSMLHQLLERVWQRLHDSQTLQAMNAAELGRLVETEAEQTLIELARERPDLYGETLRELEKQRLSELVLDWLQLEGERAVSFRVLACEEKAQIDLAGLRIRIRVDRIDELEDGSRVILDYKSGRKVSIDSWTEERPTEPQIPLYCISHPDVAAGILAQVNRSRMGMLGIARDDNIAPGLSTLREDDAGSSAWETLLGQWRERLGLLAQEVLDGIATVQPKEAASCEYCDLPSLCRVSYQTDPGEDEKP